MTAKADNDSGWTTTACKIGRRTTKGTDKSQRCKTAETRSGNDSCRGGRWRQWMTTAADDNNGDGEQ
jgi:hypothetical protein